MSAASANPETTQRIDRWLWCARFYKSRSLATEAISNGRVEINGVRAKPSRPVRVGDLVMVAQPPFRREIKVLALSPRRLGAALAENLYQESDESVRQRAEVAERHRLSGLSDAEPWGKLNKKQRRERGMLKKTLHASTQKGHEAFE